MTLQDCFDKVTERVKYFSCATRDIDPTSIAFTELSDPTRLCQAPLVSVLMRAYNAEATIGRAIESIVTQETDFPFELIIADDASTDGTVAVCQEWLTKHPDKIRILRAHKNGGLVVNDVLTHSQARGEWIAECDCDDYWLETCKLQRQMILIRKHGAVLCVTDYLIRDVRDNRLYMYVLPTTEIIPPREFAQAYYQTNTLLYSRAAYEQMVREIPLDFQGDTRKEQCLARYGKVVCLHDVASIWHVGGGAYSSRSEANKAMIVILSQLALFRYGPRAAKKAHAITVLTVLRQALHPKTGFSAQEWQEIRPFILPLVKHVFWRLLPNPTAISLYLKIRSRARRLHAANRRDSATMTAQGPQAGAFHLALASDANPGYLAGLTVAAASALRHLSPQAALTVHVLDLGIPDADFAQIEAILRKVRADVSVRRHPIDPARFKDLPPWKGSLAAYARLSLPALLPEVDWVCYADCDVLFTGDLTDLFALADSTFWMLGHSHDLPALPSVAAAQHRWHEAHGLPYDKTHYVCSGLLLMNLRAFREQDLTTRCLDFCRTYLDSRTPDQDALNAVCREHMGILPDFWGTIDPQCAPRALQGAFPFMGMVPWCATRDRFCWYAGVYVRELARLWRLTADKIIPKDSPWRDAMPLLRGLWWQRWLSPLLWLRLPRWMAAPPWVRGRRARLKRLWFRRGEPIPESDFWIE